MDNASTDRTHEIMQSARHALGATVIREPRRGKSFALNTGIAAAKGPLLVFMDDDVLPEPNCLLGYIAAAERHPQAGVFAGQIRPAWTGTPPTWLRHLTDIGRSWGCTPISQPEEEVAFYQVKGANLMIRRSALGRMRFDVDRLNFTATQSQGGSEDTALAREISELGHAIIYLPSACVHHIIQPSEMTVRAVFRRYARIGRSGIMLEEQTAPLSAAQIAMGSALHQRARAGRKLARAAVKYLRGRSHDAAETMLDAAKCFGSARALDELRIQRRVVPTPVPQVGGIQTDRNI